MADRETSYHGLIYIIYTSTFYETYLPWLNLQKV